MYIDRSSSYMIEKERETDWKDIQRCVFNVCVYIFMLCGEANQTKSFPGFFSDSIRRILCTLFEWNQVASYNLNGYCNSSVYVCVCTCVHMSMSRCVRYMFNLIYMHLVVTLVSIFSKFLFCL